jgi:hypothetical protein
MKNIHKTLFSFPAIRPAPIAACTLIIVLFIQIVIISSHNHLSQASLIASGAHGDHEMRQRDEWQGGESCPECELIVLEGCKLHCPVIIVAFNNCLLRMAQVVPCAECQPVFVALHDSRAPPPSS